LEQYAIQNDYDFEEFGLRVWGICVTWEEKSELNQEVLEKLQIAYEADIVDDYSYWFIDEAKKLDILEKTYVVLWASANESETSFVHIVHIINFLLDNLDWKEQPETNDESDEDEKLEYSEDDFDDDFNDEEDNLK
jgi:hypothetical protein